MTEGNVDTALLQKLARLRELRVAHRDLDQLIRQLADSSESDELLIRRLKVRKLRLKDMIARLESESIPDLNA
jgi:hypothetical protein